jgi:hypothetical protein
VTCSNPTPNGKTNKLFQAGSNIVVQRAPVLSCLTVHSGILKKFQRPMTKRRAYSKNAEDALMTHPWESSDAWTAWPSYWRELERTGVQTSQRDRSGLDRRLVGRK